jgi:hypothetical protein
MLESGEALRTWALAESPALGAVIAAEQLPDHRRAYLDYEGPVSGERGIVCRWDSGEFTVLSESADRLVIRFIGERLNGEAALRRHTEGTSEWEFSLRT